MRVVELVTPVTEPQEDDVALVMRDSSPAMVSLKDAVESFAGGSLSTLASRVAELEATRPTILTFASREAFEAAVVADWVTGWTVDHLGVTLEYKRDASGTAIESDNGVKGSPAEEAYVEHYGYGVAAISAMASDRGVVRVLTGFAVPTSVQIDVGVIFEPEAYFTIAAGATVDFRRRIQAPVDQWVIRGDGSFTMASADDTGENARTVEAAWFGVLPTTDTETDMAPRITKMVQGIGGTENVINFAQGRFTISTAVAALPRGTWIKGAGKRRTVFAVTANSFDVFTTGGDVCRFTELNFEVDASKIAWRTSGSYIKILHGECEIKEVRAGSADKNFVILGANAVVENVSGIWGASASSTSSLVSVAGNYASIKGVRSNTTATYGPGCLVDIGTDAVGGIDVVSVQDVFSISPTVAVKVNATAGQVRNVNLSNLQEYMYTGANPASWVDIKATSYAIENVRIDQWQASGRATDAINVEAIGANISGVLIGQGKANGTTGAGVKFTTGTGRQITNIAIDPSADIYSRANPISINGTGTLSWLPVGQPEASQFGIKPGVNIPVGLVEAATRDVASRGQKLYFRGANSAYLFTDTAIFHCSIYGDGSSGKWSTGQETVFKTVGAGTPRQWHDKGTGVPADDISRPLLVAGRSELTVNNIRIDNDAGWEHDILMPATRAVSIERVTTGGASSVSVVFDQTWSDRNTTLKALHPTIVPGAGCNECMTFDCDLGGDVEGLGIIGTVRDPDDYTGTDWWWGWGGASDFHDVGSRITGAVLNAACDNGAGMVQGILFSGTAFRVGGRERMLTIDRATRVIIENSYAEASDGDTAYVDFTSRTAANWTQTICFKNCNWIRNNVRVDGVVVGGSVTSGNSGMPFLDTSDTLGNRWASGMFYGANGMRPVITEGASLGTSSYQFLNIRGRRFRSLAPDLWFRTLQDGVTTPRICFSVGNSNIRVQMEKEAVHFFKPGITVPSSDDAPSVDPEDANNGVTITPTGIVPVTDRAVAIGSTSKAFLAVRATTMYPDEIRFGAATGGGTRILRGTGSPEGVVTAPPPAIYFQEDAGGTVAGVWEKRSGTGNTGWISLGESEGTWTPTIIGSTTPGTQTYAQQLGAWVKRGTLVTCQFRVALSALDPAAAGNALLGGLPFPVASKVTNLIHTSSVGFVSGITPPVGHAALSLQFADSATSAVIATNNLTTVTSLAWTGVGASAQLRGQFSYRTTS